MDILFLVAICLLLSAPRTTSGRFYPTIQQTVSPPEDMLRILPQVGTAKVRRDSRLDRASINATSSSRPQMGLVSDQPGASVNYYAAHETEFSGDYHGVIATMDVYGFTLSVEQLSSACIWILNTGGGALSNYNIIQIGWQVSPYLYGDSKTHFFTVWTRDGFKETGCYNTRCSGFESESGATVAPGAAIDNISQPKGAKQNLTIKVVKDDASGDWLVHYGLNADPTLIGRFPSSLFTGLADKATAIEFGSMVSTRTTNLAPMGSGFLPSAAGDVSAAASFSNLQFIDRNGRASPVASDLPDYVSNWDLYSVTPIVDGRFFYGGPSRPTI
ncbi:hypothetical protein ACP70R_005368 [Stipagrostis hirtigluma subsp. patula]